MITRKFLRGWHWDRCGDWVLLPTIAIRTQKFFSGRYDVWVRLHWLRWTYRAGWSIKGTRYVKR